MHLAIEDRADAVYQRIGFLPWPARVVLKPVYWLAWLVAAHGVAIGFLALIGGVAWLLVRLG